jgi:hypothetical protein
MDFGTFRVTYLYRVNKKKKNLKNLFIVAISIFFIIIIENYSRATITVSLYA